MTRRTLVTAMPFAPAFLQAQNQGSRTRNVFLVTTDGLRWQEVFRGADAALMRKESGVDHPEKLKQRFWRETAGELAMKRLIEFSSGSRPSDALSATRSTRMNSNSRNR